LRRDFHGDDGVARNEAADLNGAGEVVDFADRGPVGWVRLSDEDLGHDTLSFGVEQFYLTELQ